MSQTIVVGKPAPDFELPATGGRMIRLSDLRGRPVVLYFYPKDATPGCTQEGQDFRDQYQAFLDRGAIILGISRDSVRSHENFKTKQGFPFDLLADTDETVCGMYGVMVDKVMYGRPARGIERSTFLIDGQGVLRREWRKVKVQGHVGEVLSALDELSGG